ncbi:MAG: FAD-dependent oxidoreductase [Spirochaetia bacterium]|jgi:nitrite reductase (NADH) large subunit
MADPRRVLIVGNGIAGVMVAAKLRAQEPDPDRLQVEIYTREPFEYYSRIRLPEIFASRLNAQDLEIYKQAWYGARHIQVYKNQDVVRIEREKREVITRNGTAISYDELVLCTGADSFKPPIRNVDLDGVFTIREYGDADAIRKYVTAGTRHAVVVGGGLLGLETARFIEGPEIEGVTVVEIMPRLLPRQLDETGSRMLQAMLEGPKCAILTGAQVSSFLGDRKVHGVQLSDGRELPAETVLISAGISPRISLAREAGLAVHKGVIVDECLRTSDPHIWAAGDIVEFQGIVWGIIPAALDHAPVVASNILGKTPSVYRQTIPQNTLKVAGISVTSIGKVTFEKGEGPRFQVIEKADEARGRYEKYVMQNGTLVGCILLGSRDNFGFATQRIGKPVTMEEVRIRLW